MEPDRAGTIAGRDVANRHRGEAVVLRARGEASGVARRRFDGEYTRPAGGRRERDRAEVGAEIEQAGAGGREREHEAGRGGQLVGAEA